MNKIVATAAAAITALGWSASAHAVDVDFTASLTGTCSLAVPTPGLLALNADGTELSSEEVGGLAAVATVLAIGSATVTVGAPDLTVTAGATNYDATNEVVEVSYLGASGLSTVSQSYTSSETTFNISTIPLSVLTVNAKVTNPASFDAGDYRVRTVVTCS